ncbi:MAG: hypothetical protein NC320_03135 [Clostridium sp.]|nr:hypothetical protein [Clostridium sp.]
MKVKYIGSKSSPLSLIKGKLYECIEVLEDIQLCRVIDETGEDYLYPIGLFRNIDSVTSADDILDNDDNEIIWM